MSFNIDQKLIVTDKTDSKKYPAKVVEIDKDKELVKVHFIDWKKTYDEWLPFNSNRVHDESESENKDSFCDSQEEGSIGAAIGRLLLAVELKSRKLVSNYDVRLSFKDNCRNFNKFKVGELESCASALKIEVKTEDGKKKYNKPDLVGAIVSKIVSHLPHTCGSCSEEYTVQLDDTILYECHACGVPSHCCTELKKIQSLYPGGLPGGFVWLCGMCIETKKSKPPGTPENEDSLNLDEAEKETVKGKEEASEEVEKTESNQEEPSKQKQNEKILCKFYVYKKCKHGAKGNGCPFAHPKKCFKFCSDGTHKKRGCNKGKECTFFHPPLCRSALKNRVCDKQDCKFHHVKGTKLRSDMVEPEVLSLDNPDGQHFGQPATRKPVSRPRGEKKSILQQRSYANLVSSDRKQKDQGEPVSGLRERTQDFQPNREKDASNFLELRNQIQQMQLQMKNLMMMSSPQQTVMAPCRCRTNCH